MTDHDSLACVQTYLKLLIIERQNSLPNGKSLFSFFNRVARRLAAESQLRHESNHGPTVTVGDSPDPEDTTDNIRIRQPLKSANFSVGRNVGAEDTADLDE